MKTPILTPKTAVCLAAIGVISSASAQVATVDVSNPTNPVVTYDANPYLYAPDLPPDPTAIYLDALVLPTGSDITSANTFALEYASLKDAGVFEGMAALEFGRYEAMAPAVQTDDTPPDTYSTNPATSYYTAPTNNPPLVTSANSGPFYFDFGGPSSPVEPGYTQVTPYSAYSASTGYGWGDTSRVDYRDRGGADLLARDFCLPQTPFYLDLADGAYVVTVLSGDAIIKSGMSVRANGLPEISPGAPAGEYAQQSFPVTVSNNRLRLDFIGSICHVNAITIVKDDRPHKPTIFVASDSTAAAYTQYQYPLTGWGDRIQNYFSDAVVVDDLAQPGRSSRSYVDEGWLDTIVNRIRPNDYLFFMMAINDNAKDSRYTDPATTFKAYARLYVNAARSRGAIPVFVTSQTKRTYDIYGRFFNSVGNYPQAMRELGAELNVPVIDLNVKSINLWNVIGPEATANAYMYFPPGEYPGWPNGDADYIHFQDRGATALAKQVVDGIRELKLPIAQYILPVLQPSFHPAPRSAYQ